MAKLSQYVAFLRGTNLGKRRLSMVRLRELFGELGYEKVETYTTSGNNKTYDARAHPNRGWCMGSKNYTQPTDANNSWGPGGEDDRCYNVTTIRRGINTKRIGGNWARAPRCNTPVQFP